MLHSIPLSLETQLRKLQELGGVKQLGMGSSGDFLLHVTGLGLLKAGLNL